MYLDIDNNGGGVGFEGRGGGRGPPALGSGKTYINCLGAIPPSSNCGKQCAPLQSCDPPLYRFRLSYGPLKQRSNGSYISVYSRTFPGYAEAGMRFTVHVLTLKLPYDGWFCKTPSSERKWLRSASKGRHSTSRAKYSVRRKAVTWGSWPALQISDNITYT